MRLYIDGTASAVEEFASRLSPERIKQGLSTAVNDTARQTRRKSVQVVRKESSLPTAVVERGLDIRPWSTPATLKATVVGSGRPINTKHFGAHQNAKGVGAVIWGKAQFYPHAFVVDSLGGNVFTNTRGYNEKSGRHNALEAHFGAGIAQVMTEHAVERVLITYGKERLEVNVKRQLDRAVAGPGGAGRA
ncbi:hypothetical protein BA190_09440 [Labrys sp. WJW]|uniref:hypothetical protein n=1 Tax=Labrys sp. WJW TaxID=1737983 RepID=UPI00082B02F3|nr:hypothetical protein [Labrys sp. WJW]OCC05129.1 hypothetical protein BA190_09440 [Labrys sp. WJW]